MKEAGESRGTSGESYPKNKRRVILSHTHTHRHSHARTRARTHLRDRDEIERYRTKEKGRMGGGRKSGGEREKERGGREKHTNKHNE